MNNKINNIVFDTILVHAFSDALDNEIEEIESKSDSNVKYFPKKEHEKQAYRLYKKLYNKFNVYEFIKRTAVVILIIFTFGSVSIMLTPTVNASIRDTIISFMEKYMSFNFSSEDTETLELGEYSIGYIPKGYTLDEANSNKQINRYKFHNSEKYLIFEYNYSDIISINIDVENTTSTKVKVKDYDAYFIVYDNGIPNRLIWGNETITFKLIGNFNLNEFIKIAESINIF